MTCDVKYAATGGGAWGEYSKPDKEWEAAVASMIARMDMAAESETKFVPEKPKIDETKAVKQTAKAISLEEKKLSNDQKKTPSVKVAALDVVTAPSVSIKQAVPEAKPAQPTAAIVPSFSSELTDVSTPAGSNALDVPRHPRAQAAPPAIPQPQIDDELVMKCLADSIHTESKLILSVFDYGGQNVFNVIHHFFLTRYGVYCLVFNMVTFLYLNYFLSE